MDFTWQWFVNQGFAIIGLIFIIFSFQQKTTLKLIWLRNIATLMIFIGLCFLGNISSILMIGAGVVRNAMSLFFAYKPHTPKIYKNLSSILIIILLIVLNAIFWNNLFNLFSIIIGAVNVFTFMQEKPATIRMWSVFATALSIVYFSLLFSPTNIIIEVSGFVSAIIGIVRLDRKKKEILNKTEIETNEINIVDVVDDQILMTAEAEKVIENEAKEQEFDETKITELKNNNENHDNN